jgi:hypothetical protein
MNRKDHEGHKGSLPFPYPLSPISHTCPDAKKTVLSGLSAARRFPETACGDVRCPTRDKLSVHVHGHHADGEEGTSGLGTRAGSQGKNLKSEISNKSQI